MAGHFSSLGKLNCIFIVLYCSIVRARHLKTGPFQYQTLSNENTSLEHELIVLRHFMPKIVQLSGVFEPDNYLKLDFK